MMSSSGGAEGTRLTPPAEAKAPAAAAMDAKLMVATGSGGDIQQLKDLVNKDEESKMMLVVMAPCKQEAASEEKPRQRDMDPHLQALASSGSYEELKSLLSSREDGEVARANSADGSLHMWRRRASSDDIQANDESILEDRAVVRTNSADRISHIRRRRRASHDIEASESIVEGVTAEGDTALHVVATCGQGDNFCTRFREAKHLIVQNNNKKKRSLTRIQRDALTTYGDGENFLASARIIYLKAKHLLFAENKHGDTPLHCAARAGKSRMVACLVALALAEGGEDRVKQLLRKDNNLKETALHDAVRSGNEKIVHLLMDKDPGLARFPEDGASPMYLAIVLQRGSIVETLSDKSNGDLSWSGQNGQNALHAAAVRFDGHPARLRIFCPKDLTTQRDENGSTPLHFAAASSKRNCRRIFAANTDALYEADHAGLFPIHVAASAGASGNIVRFITKCPCSAGLRDAKGRTFLHLAIEKKKLNVIGYACRNLSLSWIMNMRDNEGNTALHLAVGTGSLQMFCPLFGNPQVNLNLPNNNGETPLDVAEFKFSESGLYYNQNSELQIHRTLKFCGAVNGVRRRDHFEDNRVARVKHDEMEVLKDSTATMSIGSVLIASVTFGATFAAPGGYIADDHNSGGTPIFARRYAFHAFISANALAFVSSAMATVALMRSGSPLFNPRSRLMHLGTAFYLLSISVTCLTAAFALGAYVVLAPVSYKTAVATCVLGSFVLLYKSLEFVWRRLLLLPSLTTRKGIIRASAHTIMYITFFLLFENWPFIFILGWGAAHGSPPPKIEPPAQAPAPLA